VIGKEKATGEGELCHTTVCTSEKKKTTGEGESPRHAKTARVGDPGRCHKGMEIEKKTIRSSRHT